MAVEFHAIPGLTQDLCLELAALEPLNPFRSLGYANAMKATGMQPWLLCLKDENRLLGGCIGFMKVGRLNRSLDIPSVPPLPSDSPFWTSLLDFCRKNRITELGLNSFASQSSSIPSLPGELRRKPRVEYGLRLSQSDPLSRMSSNHRRNVQKAQKAGVLAEKSKSVEACRDHARLQNSSMERRMRRGEQVIADSQARTSAALLEHKSGELFRATCGGEILSSILVLRAAKGAYYHSAGTSTRGMAVGASHFLIRHVAETLQAEGIEFLNLGGADASNPGLERFKKGFGTEEIHLESGSFYLASPLRQKCNAAIRSLREDPMALIRDLAGRVEEYCVYCCKPEQIADIAGPSGVEFRKMTDEELLLAAEQHSEMSMYKEKYAKFRLNDAYGVYVDGDLAHVSWLVPAEHDRLNGERNVKLADGEAEITHAVTLSRYRNRGLYTYAIRRLVDVCGQQNIRRIYMITGSDNLASQRGIQKAGLRPAGRICRVKYRHLGGRSFAIRGHRLPRVVARLFGMFG